MGAETSKKLTWKDKLFKRGYRAVYRNGVLVEWVKIGKTTNTKTVTTHAGISGEKKDEKEA